MKKITKRITSVMLSVAMLFAFMPVIGGVAFADEPSVKTIKVDVLTQKDENTLLQAFQDLEVRADTAESYGFTEPDYVRDPDRPNEIALENEVTTLDVLVEASHQIYGDEFTAETAGNYITVTSAGTITKIFGESTTMTGFTVNGVNPTYSDGTTGSPIDDSIVETGDSLRFFRTCEDYYGTMMSMLFFDGEDQKSYDITGDSLTIKVSVKLAFAEMMGLPMAQPEPAEDAVVVALDNEGNQVTSAVSDEDGDAHIEGLGEGEYTLVVSEYTDDTYDEDHFVTPYAKLNVIRVAEPVTEKVVVAARNFDAPSEFDIVPQEVEVSSDAAESYGDYGDILYEDNNGKVTLADVLYTIHKKKYGEDFTKETAKDYIVIGSDGWNVKIFGKDASSTATAINEDLNMTGSSYKTTLEDGDLIDMWAYLDTVGWSDTLTRFDKKEYTVRAGEEFQVQISGIGWDGPVNVAAAVDQKFIAATYDEQGKLTPIDGAVMDPDGKIKLKFAKEGNYNLTGSGKVATVGWGGTPVTADAVIPWAKVRVLPASDSNVEKVKKVTVNVKTVNKSAVDKAVKKAGGSSKYVTTIVLGKKVKKISKNTFKTYKKVKTLEVKTKKLKKKSVKGSLKGSKVTTVKVKVGSKKANKKYVKKYKKIFTKKNAGKKVKVKR